MVIFDTVGFSYSGSTFLFNDVSFSVGDKQKAAIAGPNGSGKSTLLKLIRREEEPTLGKVKIIGSLMHVPQEVKYDPDLDGSKDIGSYIDPLERYGDHEIKRVLSGLELKNIDIANSPKNLSGGQKTRIALARALMAEPDILLLDEPTNFMDKSGKNWVMDFLSNYQKSVIIISHDIKLMDKNIDKVLAVNPQTKEVEEFKGNYSLYLKLKEERKRILEKKIEVQKKKIKKLEKSLVKVSRYSSKKGVRVKTRLRRRYEGMKASLPEMPPEFKTINMNLPIPSRCGELPIRAIDVSKKYGELIILENIDFTLYRNEKVAILGKNGAGKSTFLKILIGEVDPDIGEIIKDPQLKLGYYSQEFELLEREKTVLNFFQEKTKLPEGKIRSLLAGFLFDSSKIDRKIEFLSGGEKTRLSIALLVSQDYNLLILDEPTTYLDVMSQRVILEAIKSYQGAVLIVSHTEQFIKELSPSRVLLLPEGRVIYWDEKLLDKVSDV